MNTRWLTGFLLLTFLPLAFAEKFTLPVIPDSQMEVQNNPSMFFKQMEWIVANRAKLNIPMVLHVGDVVNRDYPEQWHTASAGFRKLDEAHIPYAIAVGNHDTQAMVKANPADQYTRLRTTDGFNAAFPVSRFPAQQGRYEPNKSDNAWSTFRAGNLDWLVLNLELWPRPGAVQWAVEVVRAHPGHNVIVITHSFLTSKGTIKAKTDYGDLSPRQLFEQFISQYPNIVLVLSGHTDTSAYHVDKGVCGNTIYEILQDYQDDDLGGGYLRLLEIDTATGDISAKMYTLSTITPTIVAVSSRSPTSNCTA